MLSQSFNGIQNMISTKPDSINTGEYIKSIDSNKAGTPAMGDPGIDKYWEASKH